MAPYGVGHAEETDQLQVQIQEESFRSGELTQPSQKAPENVVKDALKEKTEQALSQKQVNGEAGVDYKVLQKRGSYDGTTLVRMQQTYEGKEVYGHQLTAHVDNNGVIKSVSGDSAQNLKQEELKNLLIYQKMKQNNLFIRSTGTISSLFLSQKLKRLFLLMKIMEKLKMHTKLPLKSQHQTMFLVLI